MIRRVRSKKKEFLSDKILSSLERQPAPDVEDDQIFGTKPQTVKSNDLDSDHESVEEFTLSNFRKRATQLLSDHSSRYAGEVTSKKDLGIKDDSDEEEDDVDDSEDENETDEDEPNLYEESEDEQNESEYVENGENEESNLYEESEDEQKESEDLSDDENDESKNMEDTDESEAENEEEGFDLSQLRDNGQPEFTHMKTQNVREEALKGESVRNQLSIWEGLLEMRIGFQKCLIPANKLPLPETMTKLKEIGDETFISALDRSRTQLTTLLSRLLELQGALLSNFSETKGILDNNSEQKTEDPMDEEITSESESDEKSEKIDENKAIPKRKRKLKDMSDTIAERHSKFMKFRDDTIQKWNNKVNVTQISSKSQAPNSVLSQIQYLLGDMNKLKRKTQLKKSQYDIIGMEENPEEYCEEIFDDDDFYHQLLRELIEHKSSDISDPVQLSRQWIMLQQMRSKMKRKIDTRATKGRRIRYSVHSKLVNFMAPEVKLDWTDDAKTELFSSLFGKQFENNK